MRKLFVACAASSMGLVLAAGNVFAGTTISGNGAFSFNHVSSKFTFATSTSQGNMADINNQVKVGSNKGGGNTANYNTGGSVDQSGGSSDTTVNVNNVANKNVSTNTTFPCLCDQLNGNLSITGNGANSYNKISSTVSFASSVDQTNLAEINNNVHVSGSTGGSTANFNTNTDVMQSSGDSTANVSVNNVVNSNTSN